MRNSSGNRVTALRTAELGAPYLAAVGVMWDTTALHLKLRGIPYLANYSEIWGTQTPFHTEQTADPSTSLGMGEKKGPRSGNIALKPNAMLTWITEASGEQKRALLAAFLGYMLDSMDVMLYALILGQVQRELHMSAALSGAMMSATLVAAAIGGISFGWFADRFGRVRALVLSVLVYSIGTALCGFSQTPTQLLLCRILLGLGMGGEWAAGACLVAETWPAEHRGKALALVQSAWAVGYAAGAAVVAVVMPYFGWRAVFFAGILPAFVSFWVRRGLREPESWQTERPPRVPVGNLFRGAFGYSMLVCSAMNAAALFAWWGLFTWLPHYLSTRGLGIMQTSGWTIVMQTGTFLGYIMFGYIADRYGRKYTYIGYLLVAALLVPLFAFIRNPTALLLIGPLVGFFGTGYFSGFSVIASELFPTVLRASAMGFVYNIGRVLSAAAPYLIGRVSENAGLSWGLCLTSAAFLTAAAIATSLRATESLQAQSVKRTAQLET